jgi:hypothetical protein
MTDFPLRAQAQFGALRRVASDDFPDGHSSTLEFTFDNAVLRVEAEPDFDTVKMLILNESDKDLFDLSHHELWREAIGCQLTWSWMLTNQQGYRDGLQLNFCGADCPDVRRQIVVWASTLRFARVSEIGSASPNHDDHGN